MLSDLERCRVYVTSGLGSLNIRGIFQVVFFLASYAKLGIVVNLGKITRTLGEEVIWSEHCTCNARARNLDIVSILSMLDVKRLSAIGSKLVWRLPP